LKKNKREGDMKTFAVIILIFFSFLSCNNKQQIKQPEQVVETAVKPEKSNDPEEIIKEWNVFKQKFTSTSWKNNREQTLKDVPANLKEAMEKLEKELSPEDRKMLENIREEDSVMFHFGFGMGLRNGWGLRQSSKIAIYLRSRGIFGGDDMSGAIIVSFIRYIQGREWELEVDKKYPFHFKIVDAILQNNDKLLKKIIKNLKSLPEHGELPSAMDIATEVCNGSAFIELQKFYPGTKPGIEVFECNADFFFKLIENDKTLLESAEFVRIASIKSNIISKYCDNIKSFGIEADKEILSAVLKYGNDSDYRCLSEKYNVEPVVTIEHFKMDNYSEYKKKILHEKIDRSVFSDRQKVRQTLANIDDKEPELIKDFINIADITPSELGNSDIITIMLLKSRDTKVLELLFEKGMTVLFDEWGAKIFEIALDSCNPIAIDFLLEKGADPNIRNENSPLSLDSFVKHGCNEYPEKNYNELTIKYLILKGMTVKNGWGTDGFSLDRIIDKASFDFLKFLQMHNYDISYQSNIDNSSRILDKSLSNKNIKIFEWLISEHGYGVNKPDKDGNTPLHESVFRSNLNTAKLFLKKGASVSAKNKEGKTPLDRAKEFGPKEMIELLEKSTQKP